MVAPDGTERWKRFWSRADVDTPLIGAALEAGAEGIALVAGRESKTAISPADLDVDAYAAFCDRMADEAEKIRSDSVWAAAPFQGMPWMEAMCGCRIVGSGSSLWAEPPASSAEAALERWESSEWRATLASLTEALARRAGDRYPVGLPVLRGPADLVAALLTPTGFCVAIYDEPQRLNALLGRCANICETVYGELLSILAATGHGCVQASRQVAAPDRCSEYQQDAAASIAPEHYDTFLLDIDRRAASIAPYVFRHLHSNAMQHLESIVGSSGFAAVEITVDDGGPAADAIIAAGATVQREGKPLIVHGSVSPEDLACMARELEPQGLYLAGRVASADEAAGFLAAVESNMRRAATR